MKTTFPLRDLDPLTQEIIKRSPLDVGLISGETLLLIAFLDRAIRDTKDHRVAIRGSAIHWLLNDSPSLLGVVEVCDYLSLNHRYLKERIEATVIALIPKLAA
jgi:hypothetical protein